MSKLDTEVQELLHRNFEVRDTQSGRSYNLKFNVATAEITALLKVEVAKAKIEVLQKMQRGGLGKYDGNITNEIATLTAEVESDE